MYNIRTEDSIVEPTVLVRGREGGKEETRERGREGGNKGGRERGNESCDMRGYLLTTRCCRKSLLFLLPVVLNSITRTTVPLYTVITQKSFTSTVH